MRRFTGLLAPLILAACATTAPTETFQRGAGAQSWQIGGTLQGLSGDVVITVNGQPAATGKFPRFSDKVELQGEYQGSPVQASCMVDHCTHGTRCVVYVENEQAATVKFGPQ
jgi:hypothetical protein